MTITSAHILGLCAQKRQVFRLSRRGMRIRQLSEWMLKLGLIRKYVLHKKSNVEVDIKDDSGWTPLMLSSSVGDSVIVKRLLSLGVDLNSQNNFGSTPLHLAASKGHLEVRIYAVR